VVFVLRFGIVGAGYGAVTGYGVGTLLSLFLVYPMLKHGRHWMSINPGKVF
jgi:hypothetical protein